LYSLTQKLLAEFFGTFAVVFFAAGALCADQYLRSSGQGSITILGLALAYGLTVGIMVTSIGHISGGHLNPAVTVGFWVSRRLSTMQTLLYAVAAAYALVVIIPDASWRPEALGSITPALAPDFTRLHGMLLEGVMTFFLVFVFFATGVDAKGAVNKIAGFAIGLAVTVDALCGLPFTGAAVNPARAFGPALVTRNHWTNHGVYWVGPLLGGVLAGVVYDRIFLPDQPPI
jgi:MIP family channel proteins